MQRLAANEAATQHSPEITRAFQSLLNTATDAETGQRGYLLTGRAEYLQRYRTARVHIDQDLEWLNHVVQNDAVQGVHADQARRATQEKMAELQETIDLARVLGRETALKVVMTQRGKQAMDALRASVSDAESEEARHLVIRQRESSKSRSIVCGGICPVIARGMRSACGYLHCPLAGSASA